MEKASANAIADALNSINSFKYCQATDLTINQAFLRQLLSVFLHILPAGILQYFRILTEKNSAGFLISLQLPKHPCSHIPIGILEHFAMFRTDDPAAYLKDVRSDAIVVFFLGKQRRNARILSFRIVAGIIR